MDEFTLIERFFKRPCKRSDTLLPGGDDAALTQVPAGKVLVSSTDTMVVDTHFYANMPAEQLGHKSLAINLSDLAAMGAEPAWVLLSLTLPELNQAWLANFANGFYQLADHFQVDLIGGNIARGPLSISVTVQGLVSYDNALQRSGAKPGDLIFVSGQLGSAAGGLLAVQQALDLPGLIESWLQPKPRVELGLALIGRATAAIDLSDGLAADLSHLLSASQVGATIDEAKLPIGAELKAAFGEEAFKLALQGGEDYQLCFTAGAAQQAWLEAHGDCTAIGVIEEAVGLRMRTCSGEVVNLQAQGWQHFN